MGGQDKIVITVCYWGRGKKPESLMNPKSNHEKLFFVNLRTLAAWRNPTAFYNDGLCASGQEIHTASWIWSDYIDFMIYDRLELYNRVHRKTT